MTEIPFTFEELERLARSGGWVRRMALRLVGDASLADDVVQEAYLEALQSTSAPRGSLRAWFSGVVRNVARSRVREEGRRRVREERAARGERLAPAAENVARLEQQRLLIEALLALPDAYRDALVLRWVEDLPPREIARRLEVPVATVNSRLARGLERLRTGLVSRHGGDRSRWLTAFAPLLRAPASKGTPLLIGGMLVNAKVLVTTLAVVALVALGGAYLSGGPLARAPRGTQPPPVAQAPAPALAAGSPAAVDRATTERRALPATEPEAPTRTFRVVDGASDEPVAGAAVYVDDVWSDRSGLTPVARLALQANLPWSLRAHARTAGTRRVTDAEGRVRMPLPSEWSLVFAEAGERNVVRHVRTADGDAETEIVLALGRDREVLVTVVDDRGEPLADVPVVLAQEASRGGPETFQIPVSTARTERRGDDVLARLAWPPGRPEVDDGPVVVGLDLPTARPVTVRIDPDAWPAEPLTLRCPPLASVEVVARIEDAGPFPDGTLVQLCAAEEEAGLLGILDAGGKLFGTTKEGRVRFSPVGVGARLAVAGHRIATDPDTLFFAGPATAGEVLEVELVARLRATRLAGRIVDEGGEPLARLRATLQRTDRPAIALETDAEGRFELELGLDDAADAPAVEVVESAIRPRRSAPLRLPRAVDGRVDLGDVALIGAPLLPPGEGVSGRVVDADGAPVAAALVRWVEWEGNGARWLPVSAPMAFTLGDGTFALPGELPGERARLTVISTAGYHDPVAVAVPSEGVTLRLAAGATLAGRVLVDEGLSAGSLSVGLWDEAQGPAPERLDVLGWLATRIEHRTFAFEGLRPGGYTLRVEADGDRASAVAVRGIAVSGTGVVRDARLDPLDLTGRYRSFSLRVVDEEGREVSAAVYALNAGGGVQYVGHSDRGPMSSGRALDGALVVEAEGFFPESLDPARLPDEVVLRRGMSVEVEWGGPGDLAELPFDLEVALEPLAPPPRFGGERVERFLGNSSPDRTRLGSGAPARVREPGTYAVRFTTVREIADEVFVGRPVSLPEAPRVVVQAPGERVVVTLPADVLERESEWIRSRIPD